MEFMDYVWPFPDFSQLRNSWRWKLQSSLIIPTVGIFSKIVLAYLNTVHVCNYKTLKWAVEKRSKNTPLITFSNHYSCMDDPFLWGILSWKTLFNYKMTRWSLAAHDICFTNIWHSLLFGSGKCIPVIRGQGIYQKSMDFCLDLLNEGQWIHVFPEGKINNLKTFIRFKWGISRLIAEANVTPLVLPMFHIGMDSILPNVLPRMLHFGNRVTICIGNFIDTNKYRDEEKHSKISPSKLRMKITCKLQSELLKLRGQALSIHRKINC